MDTPKPAREKSPYWFPSKRYGYGWGLPSRWEGWVVMIAYILGTILGANVLMGGRKPTPIPYVIYCVALSCVLFWICKRKGAPARWRWGDDSDA